MNYLRNSMLYMNILIAPALSAMYPSLSADLAQYHTYRANPADVFAARAHIGLAQHELFEQLPPLQILLNSDAPDDHARALAAIRARAVPVNTQDNLGQTALHVAARQGHFEVVQALLAAHVNTQLPDQYGRTALDYARRNNHQAIVGLLQVQAAQVQSPRMRNRARQNTSITIKELVLWGCATSALALLVYKLAQENQESHTARY